jgi:galactarate dehydratase
MQPRRIQVHPDDNVAIILNGDGVRQGSRFADGLVAIEDIPCAHKIAVRDIAAGEPVIRYGQPIGIARSALRRGAWVTGERMAAPDPPDLDSLPSAASPPAALAALDGYAFDGFPNADGTSGTRNILGILPTVPCAAPTVEHAAARIRAEMLPKFPNVDGVVALTHDWGCGVAIDAPGAEIPARTLANIARNPNLGGGPLVIGLGCEKFQHARLGTRPADGVLVMQDPTLHGYADTVAAILRLAARRLSELDRRRRTSCPASSLVVGLQCGGSDAFSGVTANPAVGFAADLLVRCGATVLFSEVTEVRDAVHLLVPRAASPEVVADLVREMHWYDRYLQAGGADRAANPGPGNRRGGLSNVVEKALGSVAKAGSAMLSGVVPPGGRTAGKGLVFVATPAGDFVCGTLQLAAGMNVHVFTTGEGSPYGLALAPVVKVSSRTELAERWKDLIDVDAGRIATGTATIEEVGWEIFRLVLEVASGRARPWAERWGLHNALVLFNPGPVT